MKPFKFQGLQAQNSIKFRTSLTLVNPDLPLGLAAYILCVCTTFALARNLRFFLIRAREVGSEGEE
jgi:hypothetical protein